MNHLEQRAPGARSRLPAARSLKAKQFHSEDLRGLAGKRKEMSAV